jgi:hypothetical protein
MNNLVDELTQKQAPKFQVEMVRDAIILGNPSFIDRTISDNSEGIFNLNSKINENIAKDLIDYLNFRHKDYEVELNKTPTNYEIMFKKKEVKN